MSYLKFDKTVMINLEESLTREVLRTNRLGAYHCTTVVDCNTRKYHGLLVMPVPAIDDDNHVLLSSFDETVIQHGAEFNLGLHKYAGDNFSPKGHKYIREYSSETVPRTLYRVGGVIFSKEKVFSMYENRIMIKYTLEDAHSATTLRFRPFLAFRSVKNLTQANGNVNQSYEEVTNGIKTCMYPGYPELYMQFNKKVKFVYEPYWYNGIEYPKEQERGYPYQEDLYVPGYFEVPIKKGETIIFSAGDSAVGLTVLDNVPAHLRASELLLNRVACHDKILSVVYLNGNSYITPCSAACQVLKPTCKPLHKTYIIGELVRIINLDDRIPYLLRTAVRASPVPRPGGDAITFQLVKCPERTLNQFGIRMVFNPHSQIVTLILVANQTPLNKPITVAPIAARYAALHNRAAMMGDDLAHVLVKFRSHFEPPFDNQNTISIAPHIPKARTPRHTGN